VDDGERLVFTDALTAGFRPSAQPFLTAVMQFRDHPEGMEYVAYAMHRNPGDRDKHAEMGFFDGWNTVADQLAQLVEKQAAH
ncbi:SRPBCC domain-containing protein, partial [Agrobacterium sp.]